MTFVHHKIYFVKIDYLFQQKISNVWSNVLVHLYRLFFIFWTFILVWRDDFFRNDRQSLVHVYRHRKNNKYWLILCQMFNTPLWHLCLEWVEYMLFVVEKRICFRSKMMITFDIREGVMLDRKFNFNCVLVMLRDILSKGCEFNRKIQYFNACWIVNGF